MDGLFTGISILTILDTVSVFALYGFFIAFIVRLILYFVRKGSLGDAEEKMNVANRKLRKLKKKEDADKDEVEDLQDEVDDAYEKYQKVKGTIRHHHNAWIRNISICVIIFVVRVILYIGAFYLGWNAVQGSYDNYMGIDSQGGAKTLNDLGTGYYDYYDY